MARIVRNTKLDTRNARVGLKLRKSPYWAPLSPGFALGYRKAPKGGVWLSKLVTPSSRQETTLGPADDALDADGLHIFSYAQAQEKARNWKRQVEDAADRPTRPRTVAEALDSYQADLNARGGDIGNVGRLRVHLYAHLLQKAVSTLTRADLRKWRDGLSNKRYTKPKAEPGGELEKLSAASINRTCAVFKAALNLVADDPDQRISSRQAWEGGLESIPDAQRSRNVILLDSAGRDDILDRVITEAHRDSAEFGLFVEVADATGARESQIARLNVEDLQADLAEPRLMMPSSKKGKTGHTKLSHHPVPILADLANRLQAMAAGRAPKAPLLPKPGGGRWRKSHHSRRFDRIVDRCGLTDWEQLGYPDKVTIYALRHTSIVRQIKAHVPLGIVAKNHDTSVRMIEKHYSRLIGDHTDAITRVALPKRPKPVVANVLPMPQRAPGRKRFHQHSPSPPLRPAAELLRPAPSLREEEHDHAEREKIDGGAEQAVETEFMGDLGRPTDLAPGRGSRAGCAAAQWTSVHRDQPVNRPRSRNSFGSGSLICPGTLLTE